MSTPRKPVSTNSMHQQELVIRRGQPTQQGGWTVDFIRDVDSRYSGNGGKITFDDRRFWESIKSGTKIRLTVEVL